MPEEEPLPGAPSEVPNPKQLPTDQPVTVVISRLVRPGREREYEAWMHEVADLMTHIEGFESFTVLPPGQHHSGPEYVLVLRFRDYDALAGWKRSELRRRWIARLPELTLDTGAWQEQTGLETWFTLPGREQPAGPPPRWKQAFLTWVGLVPTLLLTDLALRPATRHLSTVPRIVVLTFIVVGLMSWFVMPALTRLSYRWLYPGQDH